MAAAGPRDRRLDVRAAAVFTVLGIVVPLEHHRYASRALGSVADGTAFAAAAFCAGAMLGWPVP